MSLPVSQATSPLRQRMLEDMTMRGLREAAARQDVALAALDKTCLLTLLASYAPIYSLVGR